MKLEAPSKQGSFDVKNRPTFRGKALKTIPILISA